MAEPGDPSNPDDHDDLIGFASSASLQGRVRDPAPESEPEPEPEPELAEPAPRFEPDLFDSAAAAPTPTTAPVAVEPEPEPVVAAPEPQPVEASSIFAPSPEFTALEQRRHAPRPEPAPLSLPGGGMTLFALYALILFAVPTFGVSAAIGLFAVTKRPPPEDPLSRSHFIYQQRTLWAGAVVAVAGLILLAAPMALGVPILFLLALWLVVRGAWGVWALKAGRPIIDPLGWWI